MSGAVFFILVFLSTAVFAVEISGTVLNDIGRFQANATVTLRKLADGTAVKSVVTDTTGTFSFSVSEATGVKEPVPFALYGNFPNPFNPATRISFSTGEPSVVTIDVYSALGQKVRSLIGGYREAGYHTVIWDGTDDAGKSCAAGVYLYRLIAGGKTATSKMLMVDSSSGAWLGGGAVPKSVYKGAETLLYTISVTSPEIEPLSYGPISLSDMSDLVVSVNRVMEKLQLVQKNTYIRGSEWYHYAKPLHKVTITHDYYIDKYEVTADLFAKVMNHALARKALNTDSLTVKTAGDDPKPLFTLDTPESPTNICIEFRDGRFQAKPNRGKYPITNVSWYGAMFFCHERNLLEGFPQTIDITNWTCDFKTPGYRLPTDAEWELAAAWTDQREYAFGKDTGNYRPMNTQLNADGFEDELSPVGWFSPQGDTHDGMCDMSGNVYEWVWDWSEFYHQEWADQTLVDPTGPEKGYNKVCRGGSAYGCFRAGRTGDKANVQIIRMSQEIGFRSIRPVKG